MLRLMSFVEEVDTTHLLEAPFVVGKRRMRVCPIAGCEKALKNIIS